MERFQNAEVKRRFETENGERHARLEEMREKGLDFVDGEVSPEFDTLYSEEAEWLESSNISFSPSKGWHFNAKN